MEFVCVNYPHSYCGNARPKNDFISEHPYKFHISKLSQKYIDQTFKNEKCNSHMKSISREDQKNLNRHGICMGKSFP